MNVMSRAWEIAREGQRKFGGKVKEYFAMSLRLAWAEKKANDRQTALLTEARALGIKGANKTWKASTLERKIEAFKSTSLYKNYQAV